jgi:hypothetical protein
MGGRVRVIIKRLILIVTCLFLLLSVVSFLNVEGVFYLYPNISTRYASGYSEKKFGNIELGTSAFQVESLLGPPLWKSVRSDGSEEWGYSQDDDPPGMDYAWFMRTVVISNEVVIEIIRQTAYD